MSSQVENIFLFVPNLIGYARIVLAFVSFYYMPFDHVRASFCYLLSGLLDAFDGYAARYLNQSTKFGAILDQITDRCALMVLLTVLCGFYPRYALWFQLSMVIDIASHWIHIWASMMQGKTSHKFVDPSESPILKMYYTSRPVLFVFCAANEIFYCGLYLLHFTYGPSVPVLKIGLFKLLTLVSGPVSVAKTLISLVQLSSACINVGIIDSKDREEAQKTK
ncbi:CDP-diacylglycerol--inositol 3-phosphatidyltransferase [Halotydeus destructor]|nr:CDP-diacylglycerol--inositol 3-phosphatidyltransferase [Halotydeus destructor]